MSPESRETKPVRVWTLGHIPQTLTIKQQAKDSFNLTVLDNIIYQFCFIRNQNHPDEAVANGTKIIIESFTFLRPRTTHGSGPPVSCADGRCFLYFSSTVFQEMKVFQ